MSVTVASVTNGLSIGEIYGIVRTVLHTSKTVFTPAGSLCSSINHPVITTRTNVRTDTAPYAGISDGKLVTCFNGKCRSMLKVRDRATCVSDVTRYIINLLSNLLFNMFRGIKSNLAIHVETGQPVVNHDDGVDIIGGDSAFTAKSREIEGALSQLHP